MATVYILYSKISDRFYVGSCKDFYLRLEEHLNKTFKKSFTVKNSDWEVFFHLDNLQYQQARNIERRIKNMKSRVYLKNLKQCPEMVNKLIEKYK